MSHGNSQSAGVLAAPTTVTESTPCLRLCTVCNEPIPAKRLAVQPGARQCVPCLESMGDVPRLRRYDEFNRAGERVETIFIDNAAIEREMLRQKYTAPEDEAFILARGDDSHLNNREPLSFALLGANSLNTEFEDEDALDDSNLTLTGRESIRLKQQKRWAQYRIERGVPRDGDYELLGLTEFIPPAVVVAQIAAQL